MTRQKTLPRGLATAVACVALGLGMAWGSAPAAAGDFRLIAELWNFGQWNVDGSREDTIVFRSYQDVGLGDGWSVTFREELPLIMTDKVGTENPDGEWVNGMGDIFVQGVVSTPEWLPDTRFEVGLRALFPTGGPSPFGGSTYQLGPMLGVSYRIEDVFDGIVLHPNVRYLMSVAETEPDATEVRKIQVYPNINVKFSEDWELGFWIDEPIVLDRETQEWFVPFDVTLHWTFAPGATLKFGGSVNMTDNDSSYRHVIHTALSFSF